MPQSHPPRGRRGTVLAGLVLPAALLLLHAVRYYPFVADDALISLRYAKRLLQGAGLTWTDGERVEGYSNFLWTMLCAAVGGLGIDLVTAARMLGAIGTLVALVFIWRTASRGAASPAAVIVPGLFFAFSGTMAVWMIGGLEQPLFIALLAWACAMAFPRMAGDTPPPARWGAAIGIPLGLAAITRPDGMVFAVATAAAVWFAWPGARRTGTVVAILATSGAFYVALLVFRLAYYGAWVPNTALVKVAFSLHHVGIGAWQTFYACAVYGPVLLLVLLAGRAIGVRLRLRGTPLERQTLLALSLAVPWVGYTMIVGGDIFPAHRAFAPVVIVTAFILAEYLRAFDTAARTRMVRVTVALLAVFAVGQWFNPQNVRAVKERWEWDGEEVGTMLKNEFGAARPLVACEAAGAVPYWSELPSLDMFGLNDYYLPRHPPADFGSGPPAHELGDVSYLFARDPDIVLLGLPRGQMNGSRWQTLLLNNREFHERYARVIVHSAARDTVASFWVRRTGARIPLASLAHLRDTSLTARIVD